MSKDDHQQDSRLERLIEGVQDALLATERANAVRHIELMAALGKPDVLGRLNALKSRLAKIAKALAALDEKT
jgi:lipid A disaccharide synthetase